MSNSFELQIYDLLDPELSHLNPHPIYEFKDDPMFIDALLQIITNNSKPSIGHQQLAAILIQQHKSYHYSPVQFKLILDQSINHPVNSIREYLVKSLCHYSRSQWYNYPDFFPLLISNIQSNPKPGLYCLKKILKEFSTKRCGKDLIKLYEAYYSVMEFLNSCYNQTNDDVLLQYIIHCARYTICWSKIQNTPVVSNFINTSISNRQSNPTPYHYKSLVKFHSDLLLTTTIPVIEGFPSLIKRIVWLGPDLLPNLINTILDPSSHISQLKSLLILGNLYQGVVLLNLKHPYANLLLDPNFISNILQYSLQVCRFELLLVEYDLQIDQLCDQNPNWEYMALSMSTVDENGDVHFIDMFFDKLLFCTDNQPIIDYLVQFETKDVQVVDVVIRWLTSYLNKLEGDAYTILTIPSSVLQYLHAMLYLHAISTFNHILLIMRYSALITAHPWLFSDATLQAFLMDAVNTMGNSMGSKEGVGSHPLVILSLLNLLKALLDQERDLADTPLSSTSVINMPVSLLAKQSLLLSLDALDILTTPEAKCDCLSTTTKSLNSLGKQEILLIYQDIISKCSTAWSNNHILVKPVIMGVLQTMCELLTEDCILLKDTIVSVVGMAFEEKMVLLDDALYLMIAYLSHGGDGLEVYIREIINMIQNGIGAVEQIYCFYKILEIVGSREPELINEMISTILTLMQYCEDMELINNSLYLLWTLLNKLFIQNEPADPNLIIACFQMSLQCINLNAQQSILALSIITKIVLYDIQYLEQPEYVINQCIEKWDYISLPRYSKLVCLLTSQLMEYCSVETLTSVIPYWSSFLFELNEDSHGWDEHYATMIPSQLQGLGISKSVHEEDLKRLDRIGMGMDSKKMMQVQIGRFTDTHGETWGLVMKKLDSKLISEFQRALLQ